MPFLLVDDWTGRSQCSFYRRADGVGSEAVSQEENGNESTLNSRGKEQFQ